MRLLAYRIALDQPLVYVSATLLWIHEQFKVIIIAIVMHRP